MKSAELFDPATRTFTATSSPMNVARIYYTATSLEDGTILIAGGHDSDGNSLSSAEIYNPSTDTFTLTNNSMVVPRKFHTATLLPDGTVLIAGGLDEAGPDVVVLDPCEIYDPGKGLFSTLANPMTNFRESQTATLISGTGTGFDGQVLIAGGFGGTNEDQDNTLDTAEVYDPTAKTFTATSNMLFFQGEPVAIAMP